MSLYYKKNDPIRTDIDSEPIGIDISPFISYVANYDPSLIGITKLTFKMEESYGGFEIDNSQQLTYLEWKNLTSLEGSAAITIFNNSALQIINLPKLKSAGSYIDINVNGLLINVNFPLLETVSDEIFLSENNSLTSLDFPLLKRVGSFTVSSNDSLTEISLSSLTGVDGQISITSNSSMELVTFSALKRIGGFGHINSNSSLKFIDLSSATGIASIEMNSNTNLTGINISNIQSAGNSFTANENALSIQGVNDILAKLVAINWAASGKVLDLSGGTSAAPSGIGITNVNILTSGGVTVTTN